MRKLPSLSVVFPAYNDEKAIGEVVRKAKQLLPSLAQSFEIIVVNDGSTDGTAKVLAALQKKIPYLRIVTHGKNQGYGAALRDGFTHAKHDYIFYTDGDGQYDVSELAKLVATFDNKTDLVTGFKLIRSDSWFRKVVGAVYNQFIKIMFQLPVRDVDCDFRLFRRRLLDGLTLKVKSGAFDAHFLRKLKERKAYIKEVGVHHYPRKHGQSQFFTLGRVGKTIWDLFCT